MKKIIRLTESELHGIISNAVRRVISEDGEIGGGGATNCVGINVGGAAGQAKNHIDAQPFGVKPLKQKSPVGKRSSKKVDQVDVAPALKRGNGKGGSISIPKDRK